MEPVKDKFYWLSQKHRLIAERNEKIEQLKTDYSQRISAVNDEIEKFKAPIKPSAIERYTEPDGPTRYCKGCGEPLLRATEENAKKLTSATPDLYRMTPEVKWADLRRMQKPYCCWSCAHMGKGNHSLWCSSATELERRTADMEPVFSNANTHH